MKEGNTHISNKELILVGGGHAHVQVLKLWGLNPLAGVNLTLISPQHQTPYSGMLPGLIAGHYSQAATHIDLIQLCQFAGANFIQASLSHIDLENKQLHLIENDRTIKFDLLSINSGITPNLAIEGASEFASPVKPISEFYPRWQQTLNELYSGNTAKSIGVVGGGAAGVELIMAMQHAVLRQAGISREVTFHFVYRDDEPLKQFPRRIRHRAHAALSKAGITLHNHSEVYELKHNKMYFADKRSLHCDYIFWCTSASAPEWPKKSGLDTDKQGFISVHDTLQSNSHSFVFASGDVAQQYNHPRPHAGVFAVRQGPILFQNLQRKLLAKPLVKHRPQQHFLSILALGGKEAIAYRRFFPALQGGWVWRWKDAIDRHFMAMFSKLN